MNLDTFVADCLAILYARAARERQEELERQLREFLAPRPALES